MMIDVSSAISALMPSMASRYEIPSDGTSGSSSWNWKPAAARSYAQYSQSDAISEMLVPTTDTHRTRSGRCRAKNMMTSALTKGAHVMIERRGSLLMIRAASPELNPEEKNQQSDGHTVHVILRTSRLYGAHVVAGGQRPRAERIEDAVHEV